MIHLPSLSHLRFLALMMVGAYVLINALLALLAPLTGGWPVWATTLCAVPPMVVGMVHVVLPLARSLGNPPARKPPAR